MADLVPGADLVLLDDCGHLPALERSDETSGAFRQWFLL